MYCVVLVSGIFHTILFLRSTGRVSTLHALTDKNIDVHVCHSNRTILINKNKHLFWLCFGSLLCNRLCAPVQKKHIYNWVYHYYYQRKQVELQDEVMLKSRLKFWEMFDHSCPCFCVGGKHLVRREQSLCPRL